MSRQVTYDGRGTFQVRFGFDRRLVELVKSLPGRRWNPTERYWSVSEDQVVVLVELLYPEGFGFDQPTRDRYRERGGGLALEPARRESVAQPSLFPGSEGIERREGDPAVGAPGDYSVSRLNEEVRAVLERAFPAPVWLVGEISGFNKSAHRRHVTFHLVERDEHGKAVAEIGATLFERTRREIESQLAAAGDPFRLEDEVTVRLRARVELYAPWGLYRVVVEELDVRYTLGEAARRREEIVRRLEAEGLADRNRGLHFPELPLRVGLVTSLGSDAHNDVLRTFQESGFAFRVAVHGARVQGRLTEPSVLNALDWFRARTGEFDVVLVCRGGGSRTDLAWFDSEPLGRAVADFPLPVVVGIGHEQDHSVLDAVGWRCKTPTAAAAYLVERVRDSMSRLEQSGRDVLELAARRLRDEAAAGAQRAQRLALAARALLGRHAAELTHRRMRVARGTRHVLQSAGRELARRAREIPRGALVRVGQHAALLGRAARQVVQGARRDLAEAGRRVRRVGVALGPAGLRRLVLERERLDARGRRLGLVDPVKVVERGYAIVRREDGAVLSDPADAPPGARLEAQLRGGRLGLRSEGPAPNRG